MAEPKSICGFVLDAVIAEAQRVAPMHPELSELGDDERAYRITKLTVDSLREREAGAEAPASD